MAYDFNGSNQYLSLGSTPVSAYPVSLVAWFKPDNVTTTGIIASAGNAGTASYVAIDAAGTVASDPMRAINRDSGGTLANAQVLSPGFSAAAWQCAVGVFTDENNALGALDGQEASASTTGQTDDTGSWDEFYIGEYIFGTGSFRFSGALAEVAVYNVALSQGERDSLAAGYSPRMVRPDALVFYWDGLSLRDQISGTLLTNNNGATKVSDHPPIIYPRRSWAPTPPAAAGGGLLPHLLANGLFVGSAA